MLRLREKYYRDIAKGDDSFMLPTSFFQRIVLGITVLLTVSLAACGSSTATTDAGGVTGADTGTGDAPNVLYSTTGFRLSYPQSWTQATQAGETIRFAGRDEFISVTIVTTTLTPTDYANQDHAALVAASSSFQGNALTTGQLNAGTSAMVAYRWTAGPSAVTGKLVPSSANRFYIAGPNGKLAVYTYSAPTQAYDPAGAVDFANTFRWQ